MNSFIPNFHVPDFLVRLSVNLGWFIGWAAFVFLSLWLVFFFVEKATKMIRFAVRCIRRMCYRARCPLCRSSVRIAFQATSEHGFGVEYLNCRCGCHAKRSVFRRFGGLTGSHIQSKTVWRDRYSDEAIPVALRK